MPEDVRAAKILNKIELERYLNACLLLTPEQLIKIKKDPESTMLQLLIVSIITHGTNKGDPMRLGFLLDRLLGKVKEKVEVEVNPYSNMSLTELEELVKEKLEKK